MTDRPIISVSGIDEWRAVCSSSFMPVRAFTDESFQGAMRGGHVAEINIAHVGATASKVVRSRELTVKEPNDDVLLLVHLRGRAALTQDGRHVVTSTGGGALYEARRPFGLIFPDESEDLVVSLPRKAFPFSDRALRESTARGIDPDLSGLRIFTRYIGQVMAGDHDGYGSSPEVVRELMVATLHPLIYGPRSRPSLSGRSIVVSARWNLEQRYDDPDLSIEQLAREFAITRRHLEALFAREGQSPASFLRSIRLRRARRLLINAPFTTVTQIAAQVGFQSVNTFIRAFKRDTGFTPDEWRRLTLRDPELMCVSPVLRRLDMQQDRGAWAVDLLRTDLSRPDQKAGGFDVSA